MIFKNEALIFETSDGQRFVAEGFSKEENAFLDDKFSNIYARGKTFEKTYGSGEVIYLKLNNFGVVGIIQTMCSSYEKIMSLAEKRYKKSADKKAIIEVASYEADSEEFQERFQKFINERFKKFLKADDAVMPLFEGYKYTEPFKTETSSGSGEVNDLKNLRNEAYEIIANAFHIPPAIIRGEASQLSDAVDTFISNAIDPIAHALSQEITKKCFGEKAFIKGNFCLIDTTYVKHIDAISSANNIDKSIACGVLNPAKAQAYANMLPSDEEYANKHYMTKNYQTAEMAVVGEGGERNVE